MSTRTTIAAVSGIDVRVSYVSWRFEVERQKKLYSGGKCKKLKAAVFTFVVFSLGLPTGIPMTWSAALLGRVIGLTRTELGRLMVYIFVAPSLNAYPTRALFLSSSNGDTNTSAHPF